MTLDTATSNPDRLRGEPLRRGPGVTDHLADWARDPKASLDAIIPQVARELRRLARSFLADEAPGHTLQATALVHELYLRLLARQEVSWQGRGHFFGFAARTMRRILVDHARARATEKRGGGWQRTSLDEELDGLEPRLDLLVLDDALAKLEQLDSRMHRVVELRFFTGLNKEEIAETLGISTATVQRDWAAARAWLHQALAASEDVAPV